VDLTDDLRWVSFKTNKSMRTEIEPKEFHEQGKTGQYEDVRKITGSCLAPQLI
jgi:hypothetical protein